MLLQALCRAGRARLPQGQAEGATHQVLVERRVLLENELAKVLQVHRLERGVVHAADILVVPVGLGAAMRVRVRLRQGARQEGKAARAGQVRFFTCSTRKSMRSKLSSSSAGQLRMKRATRSWSRSREGPFFGC